MNNSVLLEKDHPLGCLTLNRPETRNALSLEMIRSISNALEEIQQDSRISILIIRANGPVFSAGHDIREMARKHESIDELREIFTECNKMMLKLHEMPQTVIAQVHGVATAAGCQLVAACDLAVAETGARFATPGVKIGLFCTTPMIPLVRVIGRRRAMDMLLSGRFISSEEALQFGLVNRVVSPEKLGDETRNWALELAQASPFVLGLGKNAFYSQVDLDERSAYQYAKEVIAMNCMAEDAFEGMTAFIEKRKPVWKSSKK
ncbi:Enoyl-CoA hydratase/carnithine racemase [Syntrophobacter sp. SbD1]|nr:Enoyl-CoA hydratase/carnithine racemase [Syntrophobacter sp. SbD1]